MESFATIVSMLRWSLVEGAALCAQTVVGTDLARPKSPEERAMALQTARFLVERAADLNAAGEFGWMALHAAAYQGLNDVIESMAGHGAKPDVKVLLPPQ
jgi:hypothetical protein